MKRTAEREQPEKYVNHSDKTFKSRMETWFKFVRKPPHLQQINE